MSEFQRIAAVVEKTAGGGTPDRSNSELWNGDIPWASVKDFKDGSSKLPSIKESISDKGLKLSSSNLVKAGTPIVCTRMAVGRIARSDVPVAINQDLRALFLSDRVEGDYFIFAFDHIRSRIESISVGSTVKGIRLEQLLNFEIFTPPLPEQAKIAKVLSAVDRGITQTEALIKKQQRIKTGLMADLLTRGIDADGNLRSEATHAFKDSPLGRIPVGWEVQDLKSVGNWYSGGTPSRSNSENWGNEVPWVCTKDMKVFDLQTTIEKLTALGLKRGSRLLPAETIFIVVRGMILAHTFPVCITNKPMALNQDVKGIVTAPYVCSRFFAYWLSEHGQSLLKITTTATYGTKRFDMGELHAVDIAIPSVKEQNEIVRLINEAEKLGINYQSDLKKLRSIKTALMQDLLTGKKRVTDLLNKEVRRK
jgi:type I restriction enzyme S subunit